MQMLAIDLGKRSFHVHGVDADGVVVSRKVSRAKLLPTVEALAPTTIAMEAGASAHYWGRMFQAAGRRVRLINPRFRRGLNKATVALANKTARIAWALLRREQAYVMAT